MHSRGCKRLLLPPSCPSVCLHISVQLPLNVFMCDFLQRTSTGICRHNPNFVKIKKKKIPGNLHVDLSTFYCCWRHKYAVNHCCKTLNTFILLTMTYSLTKFRGGTVLIAIIYYVNNTTYINQQLLKVKILATCFSHGEPSSGQKRNIVLVHSMIVHSMGSHIVYISYCRLYVAEKVKIEKKSKIPKY